MMEERGNFQGLKGCALTGLETRASLLMQQMQQGDEADQGGETMPQQDPCPWPWVPQDAGEGERNQWNGSRVDHHAFESQHVVQTKKTTMKQMQRWRGIEKGRLQRRGGS